MPAYAFKLNITIDDETGRLTAAYLRVRQGQVAETREVMEGKVFADYDASGALLGVEFLSQCTVAVLEQLIPGEPEPIRTFLRSAPPRELVTA